MQFYEFLEGKSLVTKNVKLYFDGNLDHSTRGIY